MSTSKRSSQTSKEHITKIESHTAEHHEHDLTDLTIHYTLYPNKWARLRRNIREPAAEFLGTMILILFGNGVNCQVSMKAQLSDRQLTSCHVQDFLSLTLGWATGVALGVWVSGGISGGHINPAVTLSLAVFRKFPWKKVPIYMFAQLMGALCGAACIYANYFHAINLAEGGRGIRTVPGTAGLFATYPLPYLNSVSCFFDEFLGTAILLIVVLASTDTGNLSPPQGLLPLVLFITVFGIGATFGMQTGYAINPARDLGPRILTAMAVFNFRNQYWLWCPIIAPFTGALVGSLVYDTLVFVGSESPLNNPDAEARAHHERARRSARDKIPAGIDNPALLGPDAV
ncbi:aquaporin [Ramaria rubella]|nr:aquaporin [Ramaria rubella]